MSLSATNVLDNSAAPGIAAEIFIPDQLIAGPFQPVTHQVTVLSGQGVIPRGTVLGKVTASGKYIKSVQTANDGSQTYLAIAADTIDATSADAVGGVYLTGEFNVNAMTFDASWTTALLQPAMRLLSMFLKLVPAALSNADPS